jgi:hypothetical protein
MLWFAILVASTLYSIVGGWLTFSVMPVALRSDPRFLIRRRAGFFLMTSFDSHGIDLLSRKIELRTRAICLILPWIGSFLSALAATTGNLSMQSLAFGFAVVGLVELNPGERLQLVATIEALVRETGLVEKTKVFLRRGLLRFDQAATTGQGILASAMLLWLTALTAIGAELLSSSVLYLGIKASEFDPGKFPSTPINILADQFAAFLWLLVMIVAVAGGIAKLVAIPFQNAISLATLPMKALRPSALLRIDRSFNTESLIKALEDLPLFSLADDNTLRSLVMQRKLIALRKGQSTENHATMKEFSDKRAPLCVVLDGTLTSAASSEKFMAGDAFVPVQDFGQHELQESRLIATDNVVLLALEQDSFAGLLEGVDTQDVNRLRDILNAIKLLQEATALSYLTPRQTLKIALSSIFRSFSGGESLIKEGDPHAHCAYLIASGAALVTIDGNQVADNLSRGTLLGTTALIQDGPRTATVLAKTRTTCLEISRDSFLDAGSSNAVVAILIGKMTTAQIKINSAARIGGAA